MEQRNQGNKTPATSSSNQGDKAPATSSPNQGDPTHPVAKEYPIQYENILLKNVWARNLVEEMKLIRDIMHTKKYNYVGMITRYPGSIFQPDDWHDPDRVYKAIRDDVNSLKLIQLGLTLFNEKGELPYYYGTDKPCIWQFNFQFDYGTDAMSDSVKKAVSESRDDLLVFKREGIDVRAFRELFMTSGVVMNENVKYITFWGGFEMGYLIKILSDRQLPEGRMGFFEMVKLLFPNIYDVKYISRFINGLHDGNLENIAKRMGVKRTSAHKQPGTNSLLTAQIFLKALHKYFSGNLASMEGFQGELAGLVKDSGPRRLKRKRSSSG